jgi:hypothetical protein
MDDDEQNQDMETNFFKKFINKVSYVGNVFQSNWVRRSTILSDIFNRNFILCKFNFVLYIGFILWIIFFVSQIF